MISILYQFSSLKGVRLFEYVFENRPSEIAAIYIELIFLDTAMMIFL